MNGYEPQQYYGYYPAEYQPQFWQAAFSGLIEGEEVEFPL